MTSSGVPGKPVSTTIASAFPIIVTVRVVASIRSVITWIPGRTSKAMLLPPPCFLEIRDSSLQSTHGETPDEVALHEQKHCDNRDDHDRVAGTHRAPVGPICSAIPE